MGVQRLWRACLLSGLVVLGSASEAFALTPVRRVPAEWEPQEARVAAGRQVGVAICRDQC